MKIAREVFLACSKVGMGLFVVFGLYLLMPNFVLWLGSVVKIDSFISGLNDLNVGLVFAAFLAIFTSSDNVAVKDTKKHPSFKGALLEIVINSFIMCLLVAFNWHVCWADVGFLIGAVVLFISNFRMMWGIIRIDVSC